MSLFVSGLTSRGNEELHKLQSGSTLKWSEMTEHLRRDDANPSEEANRQRLYSINHIYHKLIILSFYNKSILET